MREFISGIRNTPDLIFEWKTYVTLWKLKNENEHSVLMINLFLSFYFKRIKTTSDFSGVLNASIYPILCLIHRSYEPITSGFKMLW